MASPEGARIIRDVDAGRYEEALGLAYDSGRESINRLHVRLLHRFRDRPSVRAALNRAKSAITSESDEQKVRRLVRITRYAESLPLLRAMVERHGRVMDRLELGKALEKLGRWDEALLHFERAVEVRGLAVDLHWLGRTLFNLERYEEAIPALERAVDIGNDVLDREMLSTCRAILRQRYDRTLVGWVLGVVSDLRESLTGR